MQKKPSLTEKQRKIAAGCALAVFILLSAAVCWFVGRPMIRFARQPELFRQWVDGLGLWGKAAYVGMCILQVVVAIIPGEPLEICGGYAFGGFWGSVLCMLGLFLGSVIVFWCASWGSPWRRSFSRRKSWKNCTFSSILPSGTSFFGSFSPYRARRRICYATLRG